MMATTPHGPPNSYLASSKFVIKTLYVTIRLVFIQTLVGFLAVVCYNELGAITSVTQAIVIFDHSGRYGPAKKLEPLLTGHILRKPIKTNNIRKWNVTFVTFSVPFLHRHFSLLIVCIPTFVFILHYLHLDCQIDTYGIFCFLQVQLSEGRVSGDLRWHRHICVRPQTRHHPS
jgi:hypothetical protein